MIDESLSETTEILGRPEEVAALRRGLEDLEAGDVSSVDEVRAALISRGRVAD